MGWLACVGEPRDTVAMSSTSPLVEQPRRQLRGRGRPSSSDSVAITSEIVSAATELFLEVGFEGASLDAIAARAGVPRSTVYKRFSDKMNLLHAVLEAGVAAASGEAGAASGLPDETIEARITRHVSTMLTRANRPDVRAFTRLATRAYADSDRFLGTTHFLGYNSMIELIAADVIALASASGIEPHQPREVARAIVALIAGWVDLNPAENGSAALIEGQAAFLVDLILRGKAAW